MLSRLSMFLRKMHDGAADRKHVAFGSEGDKTAAGSGSSGQQDGRIGKLRAVDGQEGAFNGQVSAPKLALDCPSGGAPARTSNEQA
jgi:hypothetical protein